MPTTAIYPLNIADRLFSLFYNQKGFFQGYTMPEYLLPTGMSKGSREHALYLTYVTSIDYMTRFRYGNALQESFSIKIKKRGFAGEIAKNDRRTFC